MHAKKNTIWVVFVFVISLTYSDTLGFGKNLDPPRDEPTSQVVKSLSRSIDIEFSDVSLAEVVYKISGDVNVTFDVKAIRDSLVDLEVPVDKKFKNVIAANALDDLLFGYGLTSIILSDNEILITSLGAKIPEEGQLPRIYSIADLLSSIGGRGEKKFVRALLQVTEHPYRELDGFGGTILLRNNLLIVRHSIQGQQEIECLLGAMREVRKKNASSVVRFQTCNTLLVDPKCRETFIALQRPISVDFKITTLRSHLENISSQIGIDFVIDELDKPNLVGRIDHEECALRMINQPAITSLEQLLSTRRIGFSVTDGSLVITNKKKEVSHTLCVGITQDSGWDARSMKDVIAELVDTGEWKSTDNGKGKIVSPFYQTLLIRNNIRVLSRVIAVLKSLPIMGERSGNYSSETKMRSGIGRSAGQSDWYKLAESDRHTIRFQADLLPKISEIACYRIVVDQNKKDSGKADFQIGKQELLADRVIRFPQPQADVFSQCWRRLSFDSGMVPLIGKHYPEVGIVFRDSDKVVCRTSISWVSSTVQFQYASGEYHIYGFDPNTGSARRLKQLLINNKLLSTNPQRLRDRLRRKQDGKIIDQLKNMD